MQRLFSYLLILISIHLHLLSFVKADDALCDADSLSLADCSNLGNISYPFGAAAPCAESESFRLNCSLTSQAYWDGFNQVLIGGGDAKLEAPAVISIIQPGNLNFINLAWNMTSFSQKNVCYVLSADEVDTYIPEVINLTTSFLVSYYNNILLLNCSNLTSSSADVIINSTICHAYQEECDIFKDAPCAQITVPTPELALHQDLERFSCSHFQLLVSNNEDTPIPSWQPGLVQIFYGNVQCAACYRTNGTCIYDKPNNPNTFLECVCGNKGRSKTDCLNIPRCSNGLSCNTGAIGVVVAMIVIVVFSLVALYYCCKKRIGLFTKIEPFRLAKRSTRQELFGSSSLIGLTERPIEYPYASIAFATKSFSNLLGEGGFGAVYKGTLGDAKDDVHNQIAVKVLEVRSKHSKKQFLNEVAAIGRIHHVYVVRLLGFCIEQNHEMLVYEYVINGSLDKWLFHRSGTQNPVLLWEQRYTIAAGIAKGLSYLHEECRHRIVHCDIKPQNILLDEHMCPKIADFGLARLMGREESRVMTLARGTPGYMGPEFWMGGESQLSTKFDVYSYGMVLLELISGQHNFGDGVCFPEMAFEAVMGGDFMSIMDVKMGITKTTDDGELEEMQWQQVRTALLVALWCIQDHPMNRPCMSEVVQYLEGIAAINEQPPRPTIASMLAQQHAYLSNDLHYMDITPMSGGR